MYSFKKKKVHMGSDDLSKNGPLEWQGVALLEVWPCLEEVCHEGRAWRFAVTQARPESLALRAAWDPDVELSASP